VILAETVTDTARLAEQIATYCTPGTVITMDGDLGAGKTAFTQQLARTLGIEEPVVSPTFTLVREYEEGRLPLYHMDLYRLNQAEIAELGLEDYWYGSGVSVIEWAQRVSEMLPNDRLHLNVRMEDSGARIWECQAYGPRYMEWLNQLQG
jgi:tRNA threonylcarbamoyladenosine biosynthesis protein TsaE